jgi:hypothetical membrane protein
MLLVAGPLLAWAAELVTAAAWQHPHYAPLYNWVSHLGLTGPRQVTFQQVGYSPLGAVMDAGWVLYGAMLVVATVLLFDVRKGVAPVVISVLPIVSGIGVSLVGIFQGSNANVANGLIAFHQIGAQSVMVAGNVIAIIVGNVGSRIGLSPKRCTVNILLGVVGLASFTVFMTDVSTGWMWNVGMFERGAIYPIMISHVLLGRDLLANRSSQRMATPTGDHSAPPLATSTHCPNDTTWPRDGDLSNLILEITASFESGITSSTPPT